mmetsp:Transcript_74355/g.138864  ORF Transcript_74355/g.138864 Transcript_74355/m.138864 type:complete len:279 (+) Transcript_74355:52-888(+)
MSSFLSGKLCQRCQFVHHVWIGLDLLLAVLVLGLQHLTVLLNLLGQLLDLPLLVCRQDLLLLRLLVTLHGGASWVLLLLELVHARNHGDNAVILVDLTSGHSRLLELLLEINDTVLELLKLVAFGLADACRLLLLGLVEALLESCLRIILLFGDLILDLWLRSGGLQQVLLALSDEEAMNGRQAFENTACVNVLQLVEERCSFLPLVGALLLLVMARQGVSLCPQVSNLQVHLCLVGRGLGSIALDDDTLGSLHQGIANLSLPHHLLGSLYLNHNHLA